jgi:hypothetical protein
MQQGFYDRGLKNKLMYIKISKNIKQKTKYIAAMIRVRRGSKRGKQINLTK